MGQLSGKSPADEGCGAWKVGVIVLLGAAAAAPGTAPGDPGGACASGAGAAARVDSAIWPLQPTPLVPLDPPGQGTQKSWSWTLLSEPTTGPRAALVQMVVWLVGGVLEACASRARASLGTNCRLLGTAVGLSLSSAPELDRNARPKCGRGSVAPRVGL